MLYKVKFLWSKTNRWHRGLLLFLLVELRLLPSGQVGFQCNDPALSHPYTGDTISWKLLLATTVVVPLAVLLIVERKYNQEEKETAKRQALQWYKEYLFGVLLNLIIIQTLKLLVGSPRPHFFDTCSPKEAATCEGSEYIASYTCTKAHWLSQSDKSFPSGHTSLSVHTGIFLAYYLKRRISPATRRILAFQLLFVVTALFCSLSRITDRRHHWWDVLAGATIAVPILLYTIHTLCDNFECRCTTDTTSVENNITPSDLSIQLETKET